MGGGWVARLSQGGGGVVQPAYRHIGKKTAPDAQRTQRAICFAGHRGLPEWLWDYKVPVVHRYDSTTKSPRGGLQVGLCDDCNLQHEPYGYGDV